MSMRTHWKKVRDTILIPKYKTVEKRIKAPIKKRYKTSVLKDYVRVIRSRRGKKGEPFVDTFFNTTYEEMPTEDYEPPYFLDSDEKEVALPFKKRVSVDRYKVVGYTYVTKKVKVKDGVKKQNAPVWVNKHRKNVEVSIMYDDDTKRWIFNVKAPWWWPDKNKYFRVYEDAELEAKKYMKYNSMA